MPKKQKKILAVDDEATDLNLMCNTLRTKGYTVFVAANYGDAMNTYKMHEGDIDLLITDVSLPGKNGCELAKEVLRMSPDTKVLLVSGTTGAEVCRYYNLPVTDPHFLEKPFSASELLKRVRTLFGGKVSLHTAAGE